MYLGSMQEPPLCTLVGDADDWHRDDPAEPDYDAALTAAVIETCGHCSHRLACAPQAPTQHSGVWGGISASRLRMERNEPDDCSDWVQHQRDADAAAAQRGEVLAADPDWQEHLLAGGWNRWTPDDPGDVLASVELHGIKHTAAECGVARNTLKRWLAQVA